MKFSRARAGVLMSAAVLLGPVGAAASTQVPSDAPPNVYWYHHWWSTEDWEGEKTFVQYADKDRVQHAKEDRHTRAKLVYNMQGRFITDVFATQESNLHTWLTQSGVWVGDVLRVKIPGASPSQQSTLRISAQVAYAGEGRGFTDALVCAGFIDEANCQDDYRDVNLALQLPPPRNVAALQRLGPQDLQVVVQGDEALVPVRFYMMNNVSSAPGEPEMNKRMEMTVSLELPEGATCISRSGRAFQGMCPAPAR